MSTTPHQTRLAELLVELDLSQGDLSRRSRTSATTIARALRGEQLRAVSRARIVGAINVRRAELELPAQGASEVFPTG